MKSPNFRITGLFEGATRYGWIPIIKWLEIRKFQVLNGICCYGFHISNHSFRIKSPWPVIPTVDKPSMQSQKLDDMGNLSLEYCPLQDVGKWLISKYYCCRRSVFKCMFMNFSFIWKKMIGNAAKEIVSTLLSMHTLYTEFLGIKPQNDIHILGIWCQKYVSGAGTRKYIPH